MDIGLDFLSPLGRYLGCYPVLERGGFIVVNSPFKATI